MGRSWWKFGAMMTQRGEEVQAGVGVLGKRE